jgi:hypothetical protein
VSTEPLNEIPTAPEPPKKKKRRGRSPKLDPALVEPVLTELRGNIAAVSRRFGVTRPSVVELISKHPQLQQVLADARDNMVDEAQSSLYLKILDGDVPAIKYFLNCQAKHLGYGEQVSVQGGFRHQHEHTGSVDHRHAHDHTLRLCDLPLPVEYLRAIEAAALAKRGLPSPEIIECPAFDFTERDDAPEREDPVPTDG